MFIATRMGDSMILMTLTSKDENYIGFRASALDTYDNKKKKSPHPNVLFLCRFLKPISAVFVTVYKLQNFEIRQNRYIS